MTFASFQLWHAQCLREHPDLLDCGVTNLYRSLWSLQPQAEAPGQGRPAHRCDLARAWLTRHGLSGYESRRALICRGVRHALALIFGELARQQAVVWLPADVYPAYLEITRAAGIEPRLFPTLPKPRLPGREPSPGVEYLLVANPWKPLGRFLNAEEGAALAGWLAASPRRQVLVDCAYDFGTPFHPTTRALLETGRAILLQSVTKGWLWPKTFGVALIGDEHTNLEAIFRADSPAPDQLRLARQLLSTEAGNPRRVALALRDREENLFATLPGPVRQALVLDPCRAAPGCYLFPVGIAAGELLRRHDVLAIPASVFGGEWEGSVVSSLAAAFAPAEDGGA